MSNDTAITLVMTISYSTALVGGAWLLFWQPASLFGGRTIGEADAPECHGNERTPAGGIDWSRGGCGHIANCGQR